MRARRVVPLLASLVALAGCSSLLPTPTAPQLYVLRPMTPLPESTMPVRFRLAVGIPDAPASLDTARIALTRSPTTMDYFANAAWNDRIPLMFQRLLVQRFDASGRILSVDRDTSGLESDYLLQTEIRDFEARYDTPDGAPEIVVNVQAKLVRMPQREIVASLNAMQTARASANSLDAVVNAFNQAVGAAVAQIATWTLSTPAT
jgi:cholesterol transport system auxiliary component